MARKPRIQYPGAVYHVLCRGDRRQRIVEDDGDRSRFMDTLAEVCERTGWVIHAYVLMTNHYHLLLETPEANLVAGMKWFQGTYTSRFNHRHGLSGHLYQGRYKALHIDPDEEGHFLTVSTYIHLNPVRAGAVIVNRRSIDFAGYPWSRYPLFLRPQARRPDWLAVERVLGNLGLPDSSSGRRRYALYLNRRAREVMEGREMEEWAMIRHGWMLGSDTFRDLLLDKIDEPLRRSRRDSYHGPAIVLHDEHAAERLLQDGLDCLELKEEDLPALPKRDPRKQILAWWIRKRTMIANPWLTQHLFMGHVSNVSKSISEVDSTQDPRWKKQKRRLERISGTTD